MAIKYLDSKRIVKLSTDIDSISNAVTTTQALTNEYTQSSSSANPSGQVFKSGAALIGETITEFTFGLRTVGGSGTRTGTITMGIFSETNDSLIKSFREILWSDLTTTDTDYTATGTHVLAADQVVGIQWVGTGNGEVAFYSQNTDVYDGTNSYVQEKGTAITGRDAKFIIKTGTPVYKPTNVQDNSILVEKDTANRYWFNESTSTSSQTSTNSNRSIKGTSRQRMAQQFNTGHVLVGGNPTKVTWYLYKEGSPTGNVTAHIRTSAGVEREQSTTLLDSSSLGLVGGGGVAKEFTFTGNTVLATGDMITAEFTGGSSGNEVLVLSNTTAIANSVMRQYTPTTWSDISGEALKFIVDYTTATWTMQPTYDFDFSNSTGWVPVGSNITVTGGVIQASAMVTQSDNRIYYDLGSALSDKFIIDFDHYADSSPSGSYWQMFALTDTTAIPKTDDGIYPLIDMGSWDTYLRYSNEGSETNVGTLGSLTTGQWQYVRFVRDGTTGTLTVYSDSARTTQVLNVSGTIPATVTGLRYFQSGALSGANTGTATYKIDNLKIYNGVTTIN